MGYEAVRKFLKDFGLTDKEAEVYVFLAKRGALRSGEIVKGLNTHKGEVYRVLKSLQTKGLVESTMEFPTRFTAAPFEKALDSFIMIKREEVASVENTRQELLEDWKSINKTGAELPLEKFVVIEGNHRIYPKILQMVQETRKQFSAVSTVAGLLRADQFGLFDAILENPLKSKVKFRFLTELFSQNLEAAKAFLKRIPQRGFDFKGRNPELGMQLSPRMVIRDGEEILLFISPKDVPTSSGNDQCLWTNCKTLVQSFSAVFEDLWEHSIELKKRIVEIETGQVPPKTCLISDAEIARKKYEEILHSAEEEIIIMTSSTGLVEERKNLPLLKDWAARGLSVRIMAPIVRDNLQVAQELSICSEVRHVSPRYPEITIVDGKHIFQFKKQPPDDKGQKKIPYFGNTFYSNDFEFVEKTRSLLNDIWRSTFAPSAITLEAINKPAAPTVVPISEHEYEFSRADSPYQKTVHGIDEKPGALTEEDVLNKIINAKKYPGKNWPKDIVRYYGSNAMAIIHPPDYFNLPEMMIWLMHYNKQSSFGAEDLLKIYVWLETPQGYSYVPTALITDNPKSVEFWKKVFAGIPAGQNIRLVKKGELQIRMHSNIFFAGWTVPVPLLPSRYTLPPSCIMFEKYSKLKAGNHLEYVYPSGVKVNVDSNGFDAFVTFFHPSTKYSGSGTDGVVGRDTITTIYPP